MAQTSDDSLEQRLADLESAVRALQGAAAVGGTSVASTTPGTYTLTGVASTVGSVGWVTDQGPSVDLFLATGRVRVDVGAAFEVYGNKASLYAGFRVLGPALFVSADGVPDFTGAPVARAPAFDPSAQLQDDGVGMNQLGGFSNWDVVTGLDVGWYRVAACYFLAYSGTSGAPYGAVSYRRIAATRY
jgi:hypothetical protein